MKEILAIMGSPRKNKNTDILLDSYIKGLGKFDVIIKKVYLKDLNFSPCVGCESCNHTGKCFMEDDMNILYKEFDDSDVIIIASPLYFNTVSSLVKMMIDRCQVYWASKYVLKNPFIDINKKRVGIFLGTGGAPPRKGHFDACIPVMDLFFKAINTEYKMNYCVSDTDKKPVWERSDVIEEVSILAEKLLI